MPSHPTTPRRASNNRRSVPATPKASDGKPQGSNDASSVRDRIRQWQEQNAAAVSPTLAASDISLPAAPDDKVEREARRKRRTSGGKETEKAAESTPRRKSSRWVDPEQREWVREARSSSTPRRRVISDEHWKKTRAPAEVKVGPSPSKKELDLAKNPAALSREESPACSEREARRIRRRELRKLKAQEVDDYDQRNIHNVQPEKLSLENERDTRSNVDYELATNLDGATFPEHWEKREDEDLLRAAQDDGRNRRRKSQYANALSRSPQSSQIGFGDLPDSCLRSKKGSIFSQAKGLFTKSDPVAVPSPRLPSIEAWLEEQPDPFLDVEEPVPVPAPLDTRTRRKEATAEPVILKDPDKIWASIGIEKSQEIKQNGSSRRRRRRNEITDDLERGMPSREDHGVPETGRTSPEIYHVGQGSPEMSPVALKRRGAKSSRARRDSSRKERSHPSSSLRNPTTEPPSAILLPHDEYQPVEDDLPSMHKRCPPSGPHRLSTIASVETFQASAEPLVPPELPPKAETGLKRRLTTHEDLMSVLSLPRAGKSIKSARSVRSVRNRRGDRPVGELMNEFAVDEAKYMRELRTLVDGVIPVLLQSVLSKSHSTAAAGLFATSRTANDDLNFTKPIFDMGVALQRLKALHNRAPTEDAHGILSWAQGAHKVYTDYLKAWRLGFQDVVVNLAPADGQIYNQSDLGMARDDHGDIVNGDGQKVDVAYLLKRPLVRVKNLSKLLTQVKTINPSSRASQVAEDYADLVALAKRRSNEEQSRLEDEAATNIDATKARDLRTLAALTGVRIDSCKRVKARDCFNLTLHHSTGQRIDCRVELLLRDNPPGLEDGGDLLLCEVEDTGKWLLLPPIETSLLSARTGDTAHDLVVMVRGSVGSRYQWHELLCLTADNDEAVLEWVQMLGSDPLPPKVDRSPDFISRAHALAAAPPVYSAALVLSSTKANKDTNLRNVDVPIGEPSLLSGYNDQRTQTASSLSRSDISGSDFNASTIAMPGQAWPSQSSPSQTSSSQASLSQASASQSSASQVHQRKALPTRPKLSLGGELATPQSRNLRDTNRLMQSSDQGASAALRRTNAGKRHSRQGQQSPGRPHSASPSRPSASDSRPVLGQRKISRTDEASREWMTSTDVKKSVSPERHSVPKSPQREARAETRNDRPEYKRAVSSTPSKELPTISRRRPTDQGLMASNVLPSESKADHGARGPEPENKDKLLSHSSRDSPESRVRSERRQNRGIPFTEDVPPPPPHGDRLGVSSQSYSTIKDPRKPVPPPHAHLGLPSTKTSDSQALTQESQSASTESKARSRRSSSPLKHQYAPSVTSDTSSDSDSDDSISSSSSETSEDPVSERGDAPTPLLPVTAATSRRPFKSLPPSSFPRRAATTLAPSDSASQGPYRSVPSSSALPNVRASRTIAMVCSWSDKGVWESLHPDECSIVISPGLIEAYEMSAAHSGSRPGPTDLNKPGSDTASSATMDSSSLNADSRPLVAFELTPLVPLRRGTALDISIRSPPTERSKIRKSSNVMFRSRNAEECEALYAMINHARINNPTYIALQNARPSYQPPVTFNTGGGSARHSSHGSRPKSGSWFGLGSQGKKSSYRASSAPMSIGGVSESSVGSLSSAFSALKRFSGEGGMFNLNRSSVQKRSSGGASGSASLYSSSSGTTGTGSGSASPAPSQMGLQTVKEGTMTDPGAPVGGGAGVVNNMKIRVYCRESASKWRDLGAARLTVLPAPRPPLLAQQADSGASTPTMTTPNEPSPLGTPTVSRTPSTMLLGQPNTNEKTPNATGTPGPRLPSSTHTPHRIHGHAHEKRIIITSSKSKTPNAAGESGGKTLLDAVLGESCFERIARTGIAVSVWTEDEVISKQGGVIGGRTTTYMLQTKGEAEAAWVFGLVGRLRY